MASRIIPFEYCSLARAARFFDCEENDFLHWWATGKIKLCLNLQQEQATVLSVDDIGVEFKTRDEAYQKINFTMDCETDFSSFLSDTVSYDALCGVYRIIGEASGLWVVNDSTLEILCEGGSVSESFKVSPYGHSGDFRVMYKPGGAISTVNLFISKDDMEIVSKIIQPSEGDDIKEKKRS